MTARSGNRGGSPSRQPVSRLGAGPPDDAHLKAHLAFIVLSEFMSHVHYRATVKLVVEWLGPLAISDGYRPMHAVHETSSGCLLCGDVIHHQVGEGHRSCVSLTQRKRYSLVIEAEQPPQTSRCLPANERF